jgi:hypothetical protein
VPATDLIRRAASGRSPRFAERYRAAEAGVTRQIELAIIDGDWGANRYQQRPGPACSPERSS